MTNDSVDSRKRRFLVTTTVLGAAGLVAISVPFIESMDPGARARTAGAPVKVDISKLEPGQQITVEWRGKPVWLLRRSREMLKRLKDPKLRERLRDPDSKVTTQQPDYAQNEFRSIRPEYLVVIGICTHLGCVPTFRPKPAAEDLGPEWPGGYHCPCHGSRFDLAGRVFIHVPAPTNLEIPSYRFLSTSVVEIGVDPSGI